jgi:hypothetical protein
MCGGDHGDTKAVRKSDVPKLPVISVVDDDASVRIGGEKADGFQSLRPDAVGQMS